MEQLANPMVPVRSVDVETLIVSDVHLGIRGSRPHSLLKTLQESRYQRLILLGDILHDHNVRSLCETSWALLNFVRILREERGLEVVWINGNHDRDLAPMIAGVTGIKVQESYAWTTGERRFIATHGDCFDQFLTRNERLCGWIEAFYTFCQNRLSRHGRWPALFDRFWVSCSGINEQLARCAAEFANRAGADTIVCGHTHVPWHQIYPSAETGRPVRYYNSGSWVGTPATFLGISNGNVCQHQCP